jgi:hypothetical protein
MKKLAGALLFFLFANGFGQSLVLTPNGLRDSADTSRTFVVLKVDNADTAQIFKEAVHWIHRWFSHPEQAIQDSTQNQNIKYHIVTGDITDIPYKVFGIKMHDKLRMDYKVELAFKGTRIRYEVVKLNLYMAEDKTKIGDVDISNSGKAGSNPAIYIDTTLKLDNAKRGIETYFNDEINSIRDTINAATKKADW